MASRFDVVMAKRQAAIESYVKKGSKSKEDKTKPVQKKKKGKVPKSSIKKPKRKSTSSSSDEACGADPHRFDKSQEGSDEKSDDDVSTNDSDDEPKPSEPGSDDEDDTEMCYVCEKPLEHDQPRFRQDGKTIREPMVMQSQFEDRA